MRGKVIVLSCGEGGCCGACNKRGGGGCPGGCGCKMPKGAWGK